MGISANIDSWECSWFWKIKTLFGIGMFGGVVLGILILLVAFMFDSTGLKWLGAITMGLSFISALMLLAPPQQKKRDKAKASYKGFNLAFN